MTKRSAMIVGLLGGTAMRMSAAEQRAGRFLRAPDGHEAAPAAPAAQAPAAAPSEASEQAPAPAPAAPKASADAMVAFENEFGGVVLPGSDSDEGSDAAPAAEEKPGVSETEKKDDKDPAALLEEERQRANRLEEELREARKGKEPPKDDAKPATSEESDPAPKPDDYEFGEADTRFQADWARWNARQEFQAERQREQLRTELNTIEDGWKTNVAAEDIAADYPDFDEVVTKGAAEEKWECSPLMALGIKSTPVGPDVAYELAKNPAEAARISKLIPVEQAFELGQLVGKHLDRRAAKRAAKEAAAQDAPTSKVSSSAPPPPEKRSRGSGGQYASEMGSLQERMLKEFR